MTLQIRDFVAFGKPYWSYLADTGDFSNSFLELPSVLGSQDRANYSFRRALIESVSGGSHVYVSEGEVVRQRVEVQPGLIGDAIGDQRQFEGWRFYDAEDA